MIERRMESRYLCADIVRISWQEKPFSERKSTEAVLEDISSRGICVQVDQHVPVGALVHVRMGDVDLEGLVEYSRFQEIGWFVGIHFDDTARWNTQMYRPQHLTDLGALAERRALAELRALADVPARIEPEDQNGRG